VHGRLWHELLAEIITPALAVAGAVDRALVTAAVDWLWFAAARTNLFRAPIADMVALARSLRAAGVRTAVLSNSEGRLAELLAEIGIADAFEVIVDSGRLGIEKPGSSDLSRIRSPSSGSQRIRPRSTSATRGRRMSAVALAAGWRAIWYGRRAAAVADPRVAWAHERGRDGGSAHAADVAGRFAP